MGARFQNWSFSLKSAGCVRCAANWSLDEAWSRRLDDCDLWYVREGRGRMWLRDDREVALRAGVCVWMRPGGRYIARQEPDHPLTVSYIHFTPRDPKGAAVFDDAILPTEVNHVSDAFYYTVAVDRIAALLRLSREAGQERGETLRAEAACLLHALVLSLTLPRRDVCRVTDRHYREIIERQTAAMHDQPHAVPPVRVLAKEASLSPDHYSRLFRTLNGCSPREMIQRARLRRACEMLRETSCTIGEAARQAGYSDPFQFSRIFKQRTGLPPRQWREQ